MLLPSAPIRRRSNGLKRRGPVGIRALLVGGMLALASALWSEQATAQSEQTPPDLKAKNAEKYSDGATVPTNPQLEELLRRAELFAEDGGFRNATVLWSKILSEGGSSLVTEDGETYQALATVVEQRIAELPAEGLQAYRITADGEAQALLAQANERGRFAVLQEVAERYFLSSLGDQAAFELAALALDDVDLVTATRLLERIIQVHPDPDVDLGTVFLRLAVCYAGLGQREKARQAFQTSLRATPPVDPTLLEQVSQLINAQTSFTTNATTEEGAIWAMPFGNSRRDGVMPSLPADFFKSDLTVVGKTDLDLTLESNQIINPYSSRARTTTKFTKPTHESLLKQWEKYETLAATALLTPNGIIVKTARTPSVWETQSATELKLGWESLWYNNYRMDDYTVARMLNATMYGGIQGSTNFTPIDLYLFRDRPHQAMSIIGDQVLVIEGQPYAKTGERPRRKAQENQGFWGPQSLRRSRTNWMTAYEVSTGKILWNRAAADPAEIEGKTAPETTPAPESGNDNDNDLVSLLKETSIIENGIGFLGPAVQAGDSILVPVSQGGSIWVYSLERETGHTRWKTQLCDEPSTSAPPHATTYIAVDGQDAYICCGVGVVFSVNAADGRLRFARRYPRDIEGAQAPQQRMRGNQMPAAVQFRGWEDDLVIPYEGVLVVLASDSNQVMAFDRTNGQFVWAAPRSPFSPSDAMNYCLGVRGRYLYAAGTSSLLAYDLGGQGRLVWREELNGKALARGCMTADSILIPTADSITQFKFSDPSSGQAKRFAQVGVKGLGGEPLGALFSDGKRIWSIQPGRLLALAGTADQLDRLNQRIEQGDLDATWLRLQITLSQDATDAWEGDWNAILKGRDQLSAESLRDLKSLRWLHRVSLQDDHNKTPAELLIAMLRCELEGQSWVAWDAVQAEPTPILRVLERIDEVQPEDLPVWQLFALRSQQESWLVDWLQPRVSPTVGQQFASRLIRENDSQAQRLGIQLLHQPVTLENLPAVIRLASAETSGDYSEELRLAATLALLRSERAEGVDAALSLLDSPEPAIRQTAFSALSHALGTHWLFDSLANESLRQQQIARMKDQWIALNRQASWKPIPDPLPVNFGRIIAGFPRAGQLIEFNYDGEVLATHPIENVLECMGCLNGDLWVATDVKLSRLSPLKEPRFALELNQRPVSLSPLAQDGVLVCHGEYPGRLLAVDAIGNVHWDRELGQQGLATACQTFDGHLLVSSVVTGQLIDLDATASDSSPFKAISITDLNPLPNGNLLTTSSLNGEILELNRDGKTIFRKRGLSQAREAIRLANGTTVVACSQGIIALNQDGNPIWSYKAHGAANCITSF
jgi:outer membrane protein assembly factor BamB/tetratricopeptide (TPR) repeat protein